MTDFYDFKFNVSVFALIVLAILLEVGLNYSGNEDKVIHIKKVTTISDGDRTKYKVFAKEGVYENTDRLFIGKFDSSDLQNQLIDAKECKVHLMGHRIPFLSMYKDITKIYWCKSDIKGKNNGKDKE